MWRKRGVILLAAQKQELPLFEYTPLQVKSAVTGCNKRKTPSDGDDPQAAGAAGGAQTRRYADAGPDYLSWADGRTALKRRLISGQAGR